MTPTVPHQQSPSLLLRDGRALLGHLGWFFLVIIVLVPATGQGGGAETTSLDARVAVLTLTVDVEPTGVALDVRTGQSPEAPFLEPGRLALRSGRTLWLADTGLGPSARELGRAARGLVQRARIERGAMASHLQVSLRAGQQVGWWEMYAVQRALEHGLEGRPGFTAPATLRIALNSGPWDWRSSEGQPNSSLPAMRSVAAQ